MRRELRLLRRKWGFEMISNKKAFESAQIVVEYCKEQQGCQNCIFRKHGADHWNCHIEAFDLRDVLSNIEAKKKKHGYI
jgi:nuclear transport factor 2 (NTF2) superfamily protein